MPINCNGAYIDAKYGYVFISTFDQDGGMTRPWIRIDENDFKIRDASYEDYE